MCGLAGIISWDNRYRASRGLLERMSARIAHRGPDGQGLYLNHESEITPDNPQVALAHRRLAIIDLDERANQPFTDGRGRWLVFNGEIYNYRELRKELESLLPDYAWRTQSDTEVLLAAYTAWGEKCVEHFNGMFAFAIWDGGKQELFLARDRMGQKPLYIAMIAGKASPEPFDYHPTSIAAVHDTDSPIYAISFASELAALTEVPFVDRTLRSSAVAVYLSLGYIPNTTIYRGVQKLDHSRTLSLAHRSIKSNSYFQSYASFADAKAIEPATGRQVRDLVVQAVRRQLVADVPIGCFLSGGMDSSIIAAAMKAVSTSAHRVLTFSIGFDDPRYDESAHAARVAEFLGTEHHCFRPTPAAADDLPHLAEVFGEPFADSSALPVHYLARETRAHVKVALGGDGGDELFGGYDRYRALALTQRLAGLGSFTVRVLSSLVRLLPGTHSKSHSARLKRLLASAHLPPSRRYSSYMALFDPEMIRQLAWPDAPPDQQFDNLSQMFDVGMAARPLVPNALAVDRLTYLPEDLLTKLDRTSMLHALEVRSPFMDHDLVRFASTLTTPQLLKGGPKRMLREAFAADLPAWVFKRKKMGFAVPIGEWFRASLRPMLHDHLFAADSFARSHFNLPIIRRLIDEHQREKIDHSQRLYALLMLELWWKNQKAD